ncbi:nuclear transport factor 2 family protein [Halopseudomonas nanhaiensis]|uniref:nuclear transport factor 2 family protein n=1 Tax=Halopseudomonas nanhaiensis TaxID=2830842 RepID=UPI001CBC5399|nr:nuclear transport factor 2 family protein [Halopseudomonas nanhaiensis]UAW99546.1 nuclear transport factor 2 family protein [Halopseudomonas nanhaiensis]
MSSVIETWHKIVETLDPSLMDNLLDEDVVFHSPVVHTPQVGKRITKLYLSAAMQVLNAPGHFTYKREIIDGNVAVLEFETLIGDVTVNGVDMIEWNDEGRIVDFKVMVRPLKAINAIHQSMGNMLESMKAKGQV